MPDREGWILVSRDDGTAASPALSPDGRWVAYRSTLNEPTVVAVALEQSGRIVFTCENVTEAGEETGVKMTTICPWTPVAWSMDSTHLAFFGCGDDPPHSRVVVVELDLDTETPAFTPTIMTGTIANGLEPRQLLWVGSEQVSVTFPSTDPDQPESVKLFIVP
jgi:hypothetical protein